SEVNEKLDRLLSWKDTIDNLQDLHPKIDSLLSMKLTVDTMRNTMTENLEGIITDLAGQLNIKGFQSTHVEDAHRLPAR
ncbi:hypothetical protein HPB47_005352, partial [Ixodes persulcatus]